MDGEPSIRYMVQEANRTLFVGTLEELKHKGYFSVTVQGHDIVLFYLEGKYMLWTIVVPTWVFL
jgi:hypothetical protein